MKPTPAKAEDHHGPCRRFGDGTNCVAGVVVTAQRIERIAVRHIEKGMNRMPVIGGRKMRSARYTGARIGENTQEGTEIK